MLPYPPSGWPGSPLDRDLSDRPFRPNETWQQPASERRSSAHSPSLDCSMEFSALNGPLRQASVTRPYRRSSAVVSYSEQMLSNASGSQESRLLSPSYSSAYPTEMRRAFSGPAHGLYSASDMDRDLNTSSNSAESAPADNHPPQRLALSMDPSQDIYMDRARRSPLYGMPSNYRDPGRESCQSSSGSVPPEQPSNDLYGRYESPVDHPTNGSHNSPQDSLNMSPPMSSYLDNSSFRVSGSEETQLSPTLPRLYGRSYELPTPTSNATDIIDKSSGYEIPQDDMDPPDSTSLSNPRSQQSKKGWKCPERDCTVKPFARKADMQRHQDQVHRRAKLELHDCWVAHCTRRGPGPRGAFGRKDHLLEHLRNYHNLQIPKRPLGGRRTIHNTFDERE